MEIRELVMTSTNGRMSARPGYYSGRGATASDLDSKILNQIADAIKKHYGENAHENYVRMVWSMPSLSATAFLNNLYALERANWDLSRAEITNDGKSFESEREAWGLLAEVLSQANSHSRFDQTESIRSGFRKLKN